MTPLTPIEYLIKTITIPDNSSPRCLECRGACCKRGSGLLHSIQLKKVSTITLIQLFRHHFAVDTIAQGSPKNPVIRPKMFKSWESKSCAFLNSNGCSLSRPLRPLECQIIDPNKKCTYPQKYSQYTRRLHHCWAPYKTQIKNAISFAESLYNIDALYNC
jgi:hypothetical protein